MHFYRTSIAKTDEKVEKIRKWILTDSGFDAMINELQTKAPFMREWWNWQTR